jgi:hypothetical protein
LKPGVKYCLYIGSESFDEKVADTKGRVSFSLNLATGEEKHFILVAEGFEK